MDWPIKRLPVTDIFLDENNIRTPIDEPNQSALIQDMFSNEKAFKIAKSYSRNNVFPDELPIVIEEDKRFIVIEGNRRLAALKALLEPELVPNFKSRIKDLNNPNITHINVVVAPNRDSTNDLVASKHTVNYRRPWQPLRKAYFFKSLIENGKSVDEINKEYPDHDITRSIKMLEMHKLAKNLKINGEAKEKLLDERKFPITNLERFYNDENVQQFLGIEFTEKGKVKGNISQENFSKRYKHIVKDVAVGVIDSRKYNSISERKEYLSRIENKIKSEEPDNGSFDSGDFEEVENEEKDKKKNKKKKRSKRTPSGLFYVKDLPFNATSASLKLMYDELRTLNVKNHPNAIHDFMRSFLECSLVYYLKSTDEYYSIEKHDKHYPSLSEMLSYIASDKCNSIEDQGIKDIAEQMIRDWKDKYSLTRMNMMHHNENWTSTPKDVRSAWGKIESLVKHLISE